MGFTYKKLRIKMVEHELNASKLKQEVGLSANTVTKLNNDEYVALRILEKLCRYFNCNIGDLVDYVPDKE